MALLDKFSRSFSLELPPADNLDDYLDRILPLVRPWSEDIYEFEEKGYYRIRWLEVKDSDHSHEALLHLFREGNEYLFCIDGDILFRGRWEALNDTNGFILDKLVNNSVAQSELYDLAFLNRDFFILKKHGDQRRKGNRKYFVMARENIARNLEWRDAVEYLFNTYRSNPNFTLYIVLLLVVIGIFILLSIF
ncbi:MAG: hypothetical protein AAFW73_14985 [Bacteroidota bacterium]